MNVPTWGKETVRLSYDSKAPRFWAFSLAFAGKESHARNQSKKTVRRDRFLYNPPVAFEGPGEEQTMPLEEVQYLTIEGCHPCTIEASRFFESTQTSQADA
jgi:hypothetical protein